jgi:tetratricopeptide (TPR) repeat protein
VILNVDEFETLLYRVEDETLDFKAKAYDLSDEAHKAALIKDVLAMANTPREATSYIVLGVKKHADGTFDLWGLELHPDEANLQQQFTDRVHPVPQFSYQPIQYEEKQFGVLIVPSRRRGPCVPLKDYGGVLRARQVYFRRGSRNDIALPEDLQRIVAWANDAGGVQVSSASGPPAWDRFLSAVNGFDLAGQYLLVASMVGAGGEELTALANVPWTTVFDFDPESESHGLLSIVRSSLEARRALHLVVKSDRPAFNPDGSTYWYFARGLVGRGDTLVDGNWREWKNAYGRDLNEQLRRLSAAISPAPVVCVVIWKGPDFIRHLQSVLEATVVVFDTAIDFVIATDDPAAVGHVAEELSATVVDIPVHQLCHGLNALYAERTGQAQQDINLPSSSGAPIALDPRDRAWLEEELELVHLGAGTVRPADRELGRDFLRGGELTWYEAALHWDVDRTKTRQIAGQIKREMDRSRAIRLNLFHAPGAGGTTVARRLTWDFHHDYPCVLLRRSTPPETAERLYRLSSITGLPVLVAADGAHVSDREMDELYNHVRSRHIPAVLLQVLRRFQHHEDRERSFYLPARLTAPEASRFVDVFSRIDPTKSRDLERIAASTDDRTCTPFYFGLQAFGAEFLGIESFVAARIEGLSEVQKEVLCYVAIGHHYGQRPINAQGFADLVGLPRSKVLRLERLFPEGTLDLLVNTDDGYWRTAHDLVAVELLTVLFASPGADRRLWKQRLSGLAIKFAAICRQGPGVPSDEFLELARRVFIYRDNADLLGSERSATRAFSQLIQDIPSREGRLRLLRELVELFPDEAHFWAHLGRFEAIEMEDHDAALVAIDRAIALKGDDHVLHHMRGMAIRYQINDLVREGSDIGDLADLARAAAESFEKAREIDPEKEHGYISEAQMIVHVLDYANRKTAASGGAVRFVSLASTNSYLREAWERAEDLLEQVRRNREGEGPSTYEADTRAKLDVLYGDFGRALQVWDNMLGRTDIYRPPVRRQIVRTYLARRNRSWADLEGRETDRIVQLLEDNLQEEPHDSRDLKLWIQAVRYSTQPPSVEAVIERVAYWKANSGALDAAYYLYVLHALLAIDGSRLHADEARRHLEECRHLARYRRNRTTSFEWLGFEDGLRGMVHHSELGEWLKAEEFWSKPDQLARVEGRISKIEGHQAGRIEIVAGLEAFFVPSRGGYSPGRSENRLVEFYLGFSYDGLRAWEVADADE